MTPGYRSTVFSFESKARQYAFRDTPGINYERHAEGPLGAHTVIDCLLWRDEAGLLRGILNYYPTDSRWERQGAVNVFVDPDCRRRGIAAALIVEALARWPIDLQQQRYSAAGWR